MRAGPSVCLRLFGAAPLVGAGLAFAVMTGFAAAAWAAGAIIVAQADVEQPAEVAPGDDETPLEGDVIEPKGCEVLASYTKDFYAGKPAVTMSGISATLASTNVRGPGQ